jgi:uncharacterized membrane protein YgdD (TMEM256/DUF423 family)
MYIALGIALGAIGSHSLGKHLDAAHMAYWHTATSYWFYNSIALIALLPSRPPISTIWLECAQWLFCGSLWLLAVLPANPNTHWLVYITPVGGIGLLLGWLAMAQRFYARSRAAL